MMRRFNLFKKNRHLEEEKPVAEEELTAILSTDALIKEVNYRDTRTLVFIYGKPLISGADGGLSDGSGGSGQGISFTFPASAGGAEAQANFRSGAGGGGGAGNPPYYPGGVPFQVSSAGNPAPPLLLSATGGTETAYVQPVVLTSLAYVRVVCTCVGETHALFLSDAGEVYSYGEGVYGQLGLGWELQVARQPVKIDTGNLPKASVNQIACGDYHSVALTTEGAVYCWGAADCVGDGSGFCRYTPVLIRLSLALSSHAPNVPPPPCLSFCRTIAARFQQTMAVTAGGHLLVWGETFFANFHPTPEVLCVFPRGPHHQVVQIAIGKHFGLALTEDGHVYGWGDGTYGELTTASASNPLTLPQPLNLKDSSGQSLPPVTAVAAGTRHAVLRTQDMRLWAFGDNLAGQCGVPGHQTRLSIPKMIKLGELRSRASKIACGFRHSACITPNHQLYMWGHSSNHKLIFTAAAEGICEKATQPGVAIRSGLKSSCCRARLIYSMLNLKITEVALGSDTTIVVTGDGDREHQNLRELAAAPSQGGQMGGGGGYFSQTGGPGRESMQLSAPRVITAADLCLVARPAPAGKTASSGTETANLIEAADKTNASLLGESGDVGDKIKSGESGHDVEGQSERNGAVEEGKEQAEKEKTEDGGGEAEGGFHKSAGGHGPQAEHRESPQSPEGAADTQKGRAALPRTTELSSPNQTGGSTGTARGPEHQQSTVSPSPQREGAHLDALASQQQMPGSGERIQDAEGEEERPPQPKAEEETSLANGAEDLARRSSTAAARRRGEDDDEIDGVLSRESKDDKREENVPLLADSLFSSGSVTHAVNEPSKPESPPSLLDHHPE